MRIEHIAKHVLDLIGANVLLLYLPFPAHHDVDRNADDNGKK